MSDFNLSVDERDSRFLLEGFSLGSCPELPRRFVGMGSVVLTPEDRRENIDGGY